MKLKRKHTDKRNETVLTAPMLSSSFGIAPLDPSHLVALSMIYRLALEKNTSSLVVRKKCINSLKEKVHKSPKFSRFNPNSSKSKRGH